MNTVPNPPADLITAVREGKCALFTGAGVSMSAGLPGWESLLWSLIKRAKEQELVGESKENELRELLSSPQNFLMVAQELSDDFGKESFRSEIARIINDGETKPSALHAELTGVPFCLVVTTNYDQLLENAHAVANGEIPRTYTYMDAADFADALWRDEFFILKAHGDVNRKSSMIITQRDYRTTIFATPGYRAVLSAIFTVKTVLFVGVSLSDPETELLLAYLHDAFHGSGQYHYALIPDDEFSETMANRWRKDYRVNCIQYTPSSGHPEVCEFVKKLRLDSDTSHGETGS